MDSEREFERETRDRLARMESAISALSGRMDAFSDHPQATAYANEAVMDPGKPAMGAGPVSRGAFPEPKPHRPAAPVVAGRGADWWLARAGAALTVVAVILLYQYAVGHGWITPLVRVMTGVAIGAGLMYWGRKMPAAGDEEANPVGLRELTMGAGLAAWFISSFAASVSYHLIDTSTSRLLFLVLSIAGAVLGLRERRSLLAIVAVGAGFLAPVILPSQSPSIPAFTIYLTVVGGVGLVLYLMRGWQSVLWITFFSLIGNISSATSLVLARTPNLPLTDVSRLSMSLLIIAMAAAFTRAVSLRRELVATGSDRYPEPIRSKFAKHWLSETGRVFRMFSPAAGSLDSLSMWIVTLAAPLAGVGLLSSLWPSAGNYVWGSILFVIAMIAYRGCASASDENEELTHLEGAASTIFGVSAIVTLGRALVPFGDTGDALSLALAMTGSIAAMIGFIPTRFVAARNSGRAIGIVGVVFVVMSELSQMGVVGLNHDRLRVAMSLAELTAIAAGIVAWRDLTRMSVRKEMANLVALLSYAAFLLVDARALGQIWSPLVSATFAIAGTALLLLSRKTDDKLQRAVGGATLALVVFRLFFVDLVGVDTIWRVVLFLGIGALFLFTSRQLQNDRARAPEST
ncbi:MAG: DUF2339 domain-containing protein [Gemmatimonadaceae bacterium]